MSANAKREPVGGLGRSEPQLGRREQRCPSRRMAKRHGDAVAKRSGSPLLCLPRPVNSLFPHSPVLAAGLAGSYSLRRFRGRGWRERKRMRRAAPHRSAPLTLSMLAQLSDAGVSR